jgi:hypothetical protein
VELSLYIGVGKSDREFEFKGYKRQKIVLEFGLTDVGSNANAIVFEVSRKTWGFADTFYISGSEAGPSIAKSAMLHPIYVAAGKELEIPANTIVMSRNSARAIQNMKPFEIA